MIKLEVGDVAYTVFGIYLIVKKQVNERYPIKTVSISTKGTSSTKESRWSASSAMILATQLKVTYD